MVKSCKICKQPFTKSSFLSFHAIPKIPELRKKWMLALRLQENTIVPSAIICSKHFAKDDFVLPVKKNAKRLLKKDAIPSLRIVSDSSVDSSDNNNIVHCNPLLEHSYVKIRSEYNDLDHDYTKDSKISKKKPVNSISRIQNETSSKSYLSLRQKLMKNRLEIKYLNEKNHRLEKTVLALKNVIKDLKQKNEPQISE